MKHKLSLAIGLFVGALTIVAIYFFGFYTPQNLTGFTRVELSGTSVQDLKEEIYNEIEGERELKVTKSDTSEAYLIYTDISADEISTNLSEKYAETPDEELIFTVSTELEPRIINRVGNSIGMYVFLGVAILVGIFAMFYDLKNKKESFVIALVGLDVFAFLVLIFIVIAGIMEYTGLIITSAVNSGYVTGITVAAVGIVSLFAYARKYILEDEEKLEPSYQKFVKEEQITYFKLLALICVGALPILIIQQFLFPAITLIFSVVILYLSSQFLIPAELWFLSSTLDKKGKKASLKNNKKSKKSKK